jgi:xylan 1,4-beta-xylosidase
MTNIESKTNSISRREIFALGFSAVLASNINPLRAVASFAAQRPGQKHAGDQGDGTYLNPIVGGDHPDAGAIRVGEDFYITHTSFSYTPGLVIMTSKNLVNWRIAGCALNRFYGEIWAPFLCEHAGHFYIYYPRSGHLEVAHAPHPLGPWSEPVALGIDGIDPGHIATPEGRRFLYIAGGSLVELAKDGLSVIAPPRKVFSPWPIPEDWQVECECLEAPKPIYRNGYFYLNVAEGGTSGPPTSHMVISARSRNVDGPWEYSPYNPIVHTWKREDRWWSSGHGRLVDDARGGWWITFHAYENGYSTLGRSTLLLPVEWTPDEWFRVPKGVTAASKLALPPGQHERIQRFQGDDFTSPTLGLHWQFWKGYDPNRFKTGDGQLILKGVGASLNDSPVMTVSAADHSYVIEVDVEVAGSCEAGVLLFYDEGHSMGLRIGPLGLGVHRQGDVLKAVTRGTLRIANRDQVIDFYYKLEGGQWVKLRDSVDASCYQQNILGGFHDLRPALFAFGEGYATFRSFRYLTEFS